MSLVDSAKNKNDRLAAVATDAYEITLVQTGFRCHPNAFTGYLPAPPTQGIYHRPFMALLLAWFLNVTCCYVRVVYDLHQCRHLNTCQFLFLLDSVL